VTVPLGPIDPTDFIGIGGGLQSTPVDSAKVVGDYVVEPHLVPFAVDAVEKLDQFDWLDDQPGLLADLADKALVERLPQFQKAPGKRPAALQRLFSAPDQQHTAFLHYDCADPDEGYLRKLSLHSSPDHAPSQKIVSPAIRYATEVLSYVDVVPSESSPLAYHQNEAEGSMAEFTLHIDGMHCGSCIRRVTQALATDKEIEVEEVRLGGARLKAPDGLDPVNHAIEALAKAGYTARLDQ